PSQISTLSLHDALPIFTTGRRSLMFISRTSLGELCRRSLLWGLSRRTRAIDHLLYENNSGFWRWVTGGCGNVLSIGVLVIASTRDRKSTRLNSSHLVIS